MTRTVATRIIRLSSEAPPITRLRASTGRFLALATAFAAATTAADEGLYLGLATSAAFYDVDYGKSVDSRHPDNVSANAGRIFSASDSADDTTWDAGLLLGYRLGLGPLHLDIEGDVVTHSGEASGRHRGAGASPGRNQLGEAWPESWSLAKDRSYGITARLGAPVPMFGADVSAFVGIRRLDATFRTSYTGCLLVTACLSDEFTDGRERHDEKYDARIAGVALERSLGPVALRGELRYTDHGSSKRTVRFDDVAVTVPVDLESGELGLGVSLIWRP